MVTEKSLETFSPEVLTPYGPRMCDVLCNTREGCSDVVFDEIKLSCHLVFNKSRDLTGNPSDLGLNGRDANTQSKTRGENMDRQKGPLCPSGVVDSFLEACGKGNLTEVKRLLFRGMVDVNCRRQRNGNDFEYGIVSNGVLGDSPLLVAASSGHIPVVKLLTQKGADVEAVNTKHDNMLHLTCLNGYVEMVEYILLLKILDIDGRGSMKRTPILNAVQGGDIPTVKLLVRNGANVKATDESNNTMLHLSSTNCYVSMVEYVLSLKALDIDCIEFTGRTALMNAVSCGQIEVVKLLQEHKANVTTSDYFGCNLLHLAVERGDRAMVKYLCTLEELKGFELRENKKGHTPLAWARLAGHNLIAQFLNLLH